MNTQNKEFIIKIDDNKVFFNLDLFISFEQTNLPPNEYLKLKSGIYWRVKLLEFNELNNELQVQILEYNSKNNENFETRKAKNKPSKLMFQLPFDWSKIDEISYLSQKAKLIELGFITDQTLENSHTQKVAIDSFNDSNNLSKNPPKERKIMRSVGVPLNNTQFKSGRVAFNGRIKGINEELFFDVENIHILEKFDFIKAWFTRKLKILRWEVDITITLIGNEVKVIDAISKDVDKITPELIENIKYDRTVNLIKNPVTEDSEQELFSVEEIFSQIDKEKKEKNTFEQSEKDILNTLLKKNGRNKKQLEYLSEEKQSLNYPLKFTLNPNFGFLFTIESYEKNHFVWELLETHATYIWSMNKSTHNIQKQFEKVENAISIIKKFGRDEYRRNYQRNEEFLFNHINHDNIITQHDKHFNQWKDKLNEYLS